MKHPIQKQNHVLFMLLAALLLAALGCNVITTKVGSLQQETQTIDRQDAADVRVDVEMGIGELKLGGDATQLLQADFEYNVADWKPEVTYQVTDGSGRLRIDQPNDNISGIPDNDITYRWTLNFNNDVPLDMNVTMGAGESTLDFSQLSLSDLAIKTGAGDVNITVGEQQLTRANIETGLGEADIKFGGGRLDDLTIKLGAGSVTIDLRGDWNESMNATIGGGVGDLTLKLPRDVGVRVRAETGLGDINANGFRIQDGDYVNDAYDQAGVNLNIDIDTGIGTVTLELGE